MATIMHSIETQNLPGTPASLKAFELQTAHHFSIGDKVLIGGVTYVVASINSFRRSYILERFPIRAYGFREFVLIDELHKPKKPDRKLQALKAQLSRAKIQRNKHLVRELEKRMAEWSYVKS